jgi:HPt (histidine-containing phosphotransfer) domain-containing protein
MERLLDTSAPGPNREFRPDQLALFCRGDAEVMRYAVERFLQEVPTLLDAMRADLDGADHDALLGRAHALRGACQVIGAYPLAQACLRFEDRFASLDEEGEELLGQVTAEFDRLRPVLRRYLEEDHAA